jgi:hypothetical protein
LHELLIHAHFSETLVQLSRTVVIALAAPLFAGCASAADPEVPREAVALQVQAFPDEVVQYFYSGVRDRRRLLITDADAWRAFWAEATANYGQPTPAPTVDFTADGVIVASMGERGSGGHAIAIESVHEYEGRLYVTVREVSPGPSCAVTGALTAPVHAVRIPKRDATVVFVERVEIRNC